MVDVDACPVPACAAPSPSNSPTAEEIQHLADKLEADAKA